MQNVRTLILTQQASAQMDGVEHCFNAPMPGGAQCRQLAPHDLNMVCPSCSIIWQHPSSENDQLVFGTRNEHMRLAHGNLES